MKLKKYNTKERIYNMRLLADEEYEGYKLTKADDVVSIEDIVIPDNFARTRTRESKIKKAMLYYRKHGYFDKPISVIPEINEQGRQNKLVLIDEFARYLAAIRLHLDIVTVKYIDTNNINIKLT